MGTMTLTGKIKQFDLDGSTQMFLTITSNTQIKDISGNIIFEKMDKIPLSNGEFTYSCPAPGNGVSPPAFGYIITGYSGKKKMTWQIPAAVGTFDLTDFTSSTSIPVISAQYILTQAEAAVIAAELAEANAEAAAAVAVAQPVLLLANGGAVPGGTAAGTLVFEKGV